MYRSRVGAFKRAQREKLIRENPSFRNGPTLIGQSHVRMGCCSEWWGAEEAARRAWVQLVFSRRASCVTAVDQLAGFANARWSNPHSTPCSEFHTALSTAGCQANQALSPCPAPTIVKTIRQSFRTSIRSLTKKIYRQGSQPRSCSSCFQLFYLLDNIIRISFRLRARLQNGLFQDLLPRGQGAQARHRRRHRASSRPPLRAG